MSCVVVGTSCYTHTRARAHTYTHQGATIRRRSSVTHGGRPADATRTRSGGARAPASVVGSNGLTCRASITVWRASRVPTWQGTCGAVRCGTPRWTGPWHAPPTPHSEAPRRPEPSPGCARREGASVPPLPAHLPSPRCGHAHDRGGPPTSDRHSLSGTGRC